MGIEFVVDNPFSEFVPFIRRPAIDAEAPFTVLVNSKKSLKGPRIATYLVFALL